MKKVYIFILLFIPFVSFAQVQIGQDIDGEDIDNFSGESVSISADGNIVAVGARFNDGSANVSGHVRIFQNQNGSWIQIGQDIDGEAAVDTSGSGLSLSANGNIVAIGAPQNDGNGDDSGHVRVFQNQNGSWIQIGQDIDGEASLDSSGDTFALSLSADGNIVAVGAPGNDGNGDDSGHVRVFQNQNGSWIQIGQDIDGENSNDSSGASISLSSNGNIVAIGSPVNSSFSGHVRVFQNQNGSWV